MAKRLFWLLVAIVGGGLIVLSSASSVQAVKEFGSVSYYWRHQLLVGILPGFLLLFVLWRIDYRRWRPLAFPLLFCALGLMAAVFIPHFGVRLKGATSWIDVFGYSFQPAELLKLALIIYLAAWLGEGSGRMRDWHIGLLPFGLMTGLVAVLLLLQPDLGTLGIVLLVAGGLYFIAGAPWRQALAIVAAVAILVGGFAAFSPDRWSRITTLINPTADARGAGWQLNQSLISIGSGGFWGVGLGQSTQKVLGFLPEPMGDSIFAILVEELGLVGGFATLGLFAALGWMLIGIARRAPDTFGALIAAGMFLWITVQAVVNIAAIIGLVPLTGLPLPFISYGGTSMTMLLAGMGIVLNIAERE